MDLDLDLFRTGACLCGQVSEGLFVQCVFFVFFRSAPAMYGGASCKSKHHGCRQNGGINASFWVVFLCCLFI